MADSGALRVRRARLHKSGDHSLCRRCAAVRGEPAPVALAPAPENAGTPLERLDALAARLEAAHRAEPANAMVARELRLTLEALAKADPGPADALGELRDLAARVS